MSLANCQTQTLNLKNQISFFFSKEASFVLSFNGEYLVGVGFFGSYDLLQTRCTDRWQLWRQSWGNWALSSQPVVLQPCSLNPTSECWKVAQTLAVVLEEECHSLQHLKYLFHLSPTGNMHLQRSEVFRCLFWGKFCPVILITVIVTKEWNLSEECCCDSFVWCHSLLSEHIYHTEYPSACPVFFCCVRSSVSLHKIDWLGGTEGVYWFPLRSIQNVCLNWLLPVPGLINVFAD